MLEIMFNTNLKHLDTECDEYLAEGIYTALSCAALLYSYNRTKEMNSLCC